MRGKGVRLDCVIMIGSREKAGSAFRRRGKREERTAGGGLRKARFLYWRVIQPRIMYRGGQQNIKILYLKGRKGEEGF